MKKVFSLLLAITMLCSFLPVMASAADVNLDFSIETYHADEGCDIWEENGVFGVVVTAKGAKFSGGSISIAYDTNLVEPSRASGGSCSQTNFTKRCFDSLMVEGSVGELTGSQFWDEDKGYLLFNLIKSTSIDFSEMDGDDVLFSFIFAPVEEVESPEELAGAFSVIPADDQFLVDCSVKVNGGAYVMADNNDVVYSTDAGTLGTTGILASDEPVPEPKVDTYAAADGTATAKVYYEGAVSGTAIIAVYNEAGTMIGHTIGSTPVNGVTELDLSATYDADETVKTIKVFVWNNVGTDNTATVAAKVGTLAN